MTSEKTYHLIDDYLNGKLIGRKLDKFKAELKVDEKLQEQVALQEAIMATIAENRRVELKAYLNEKVTEGGVTFVPNLAAALGAAAMIIILVASYFIIDFIVDRQTNTIVKENTLKPSTKDTSKRNSNLKFNDATIDTQTLAIADKFELNEELEPQIEAELENLEETANDEDTKDYDSDSESDDVIVKANEGKAAPASTENVDVKRDIKLSSKNYTIKSIIPSEPEEMQVETSSKPRLKKVKELDDSASETVEPAADKMPSPSRSVTIEYWQSVVNYKGYNFDGKTIKLYGIAASKKLEFKELDNRIYLKLDGSHFYIEKNGNYNRLVEITNPTLLNILND